MAARFLSSDCETDRQAGHRLGGSLRYLSFFLEVRSDCIANWCRSCVSQGCMCFLLSPYCPLASSWLSAQHLEVVQVGHPTQTLKLVECYCLKIFLLHIAVTEALFSGRHVLVSAVYGGLKVRITSVVNHKLG